MMRVILYLFAAITFITFANTYSIPNVKLELLPNGFRVSIPDEAGIRNVAFNINRNRSFKSYQPGDFSAQIRSPQNNRWTYENTRIALDPNDVIYVWTNVQYNQLVFRRVADPIAVDELPRSDGGQEPNPQTPDTTTEGSKNTNDEINNNADDDNCLPSITKVSYSNSVVCKGELLFEDNFETGLNYSRWQHEIRLPLDVGDAEFVVYDDDAENLSIKEGILEITPTLWNNDRPGTVLKQGDLELGARCTGRVNRQVECERHPDGLAHNILPPIKSSRISTRDSFSFKYGRIEIRAKVPIGNWLFPLLVLEPVSNNYGATAYASGQIRIAFVRGNDDLTTKDGVRIDGRTLYGGVVLNTDSTIRDQFFANVRRSTHFGEDFHIFTCIWTEQKFVLLVDGTEYGSVLGGFANSGLLDAQYRNTWRGGEFMAPFDQEFYLTLGVSVGGHGDFPDDSISKYRRKPWLNTSPRAAYKFWLDRHEWKTTWTSPGLHVDYVRVYSI